MEKTKDGSKKASADYIPDGFHTVTPYLVIDQAEKLIEFTKKAFDAQLDFITKSEDGKVVHATIQIGNSRIMLCDTMEGMPAKPAMLYLYLEDVDDIYQRAIDANGTSIREPRDEFYGDRAAAIRDQWDNTWWIATHQEDVNPEELGRRAKRAEQERKDKNQTVEA
jgi:PhnB protein